MAVAFSEIVAAVKAKPELATLDDAFVLEKIKKILIQKKRIRTKTETSKSFKEFSRSSDFKELKRLVREELRTVYGLFQKEKRTKGKKGRGKNGDARRDATTPESFLRAHQSSDERYPHYDEIYKKIFSITGKPSSVLDLGCGANPYSYGRLGCSPFYVAIDLPSDDLKGIAAFFKARKIEGEVYGMDLVQAHGKLSELTAKHPFDVALLFKLLDSLESVKRNISGKLLDAVNATWLVVSFPTVSIGGKRHIPKERRAWFEKLLQRRGWWHDSFEVGEEAFYVVKKSPARRAAP